MNASRRGFFSFLAGAAVAAHVPKAWLPAPVARALPVSPLMAELNAITRKALVPKIYTQIYTQHPMLAMVNLGDPYTSAPLWTTGPPTRIAEPLQFDWADFDKAAPNE